MMTSPNRRLPRAFGWISTKVRMKTEIALPIISRPTGIYVSPIDTGTDPSKFDTDGDGLSDREEVHVTLSDPNKKDTDGDGFLDGAEVLAGKNPLDPNSKPEPLEIRTAVELTINTEVGKSYQIEWTTNFADWTALPEIIAGDGTPKTRFLSTREHLGRFFRSIVVPSSPE